jgi:Gpi18-like mannosyltransferase
MAETRWQDDPIYGTYRLAQPSPGPLAHFLLDPWYRWDAGWYLKIATTGYAPRDSTTAYPPLYPWLIRIATPLTLGNPLAAALLISNVSLSLALLLLMRYVRPVVGQALAQLTVIGLILFPTAFFFGGPFSESLYLALALAALLAVRNGRWLLTGTMALLAGLTRIQGIALLAPLGWEWWRDYRRQPSWRAWPKLAAVLSVPAVIGGFMWWAQSFGQGWLESQAQVFTQVVTWPGETLWQTGRFLLSGRAQATDWLNALVVGSSLALCFYMVKKLPPTNWLYAWGTLLIALSLLIQETPIHSLVRYTLVNFPLFVMLAQVIHRRRWLKPLTLVTLGALQLGFVWLYVHWYWVG